VGQSRLARRLTTIVPAMRLADALETTRMPRVARLPRRPHSRGHHAPVSPPAHTIAEVGLIGRGPGAEAG
jgi:predicted ATPase with chaperone activity